MSNVATQFKPGNKMGKGAPKKEWTIKSLITEAMEEEDETGIPYKNIVYRKLVKLAAKGDMQAQKELNNRLEGQAQQSIQQTGNVVLNVKMIRDERKRTIPEGS
jgi:hypothetical protein